MVRADKINYPVIIEMRDSGRTQPTKTSDLCSALSTSQLLKKRATLHNMAGGVVCLNPGHKNDVTGTEAALALAVSRLVR